MRNFPTHFWKRFQDHKERTAFISPAEKSTTTTETYWEWTRRVQRLALGLMDAGITAGTRVGMVAPNSQQWLDTAFAAWLIGACIVPLTPDRDRRETLRCLARSGCDWIVVRNENARLDLRGQSASFPEHLQWLVLEDAPAGTNKPVANTPIHYFPTIEATGRDLGRRGHLNKLAERTYALDPKAPALILFEPEPGPDPTGAYFSGGKLAVMLEYLGRDLPLGDDATLAVLLSYGWLSAPLITAAALLNGHCIATAPSLSELNDNLSTLRPTHLVCGPAFLESQSDNLKKRIESAPEFIKKISSIGADSDTSSAFESLTRAVGTIGERAAQKLLYDPLIKELGGRLKSIYVWNGRVPKDVYELLDQLNIEILGHFGLPECGISHIEHPGARRQNSVGRPVQGYICKIDGSKADRPGPILIRSDTLFDGYWSEQGPRQIDDNGYLHTHITGHLQSGYLFIDSE